MTARKNRGVKLSYCRKIAKVVILCAAPAFLSPASCAQSAGKHWVFFSDKPDTVFDPHAYFHPAAIARRQRAGLPLTHYTDLPVSSRYLDAVAALADSMSHHSRWFNAVAVWAGPEGAAAIAALPFVASVAPMPLAGPEMAQTSTSPRAAGMTGTEEALLKHQTGRLGAKHFRNRGVDGRGIRIAVFDAGFPAVDTASSFAHLRREGRIWGTYDFVRRREGVYAFNAHGTMVLSCIAGMSDSVQLGMATGAEFLLARTENTRREPFSEEENWLAAAEWADRHGAHIINSSLGYTYHRYFRDDMDGKTSLIARAANMAAAKGILVVNAAGNDGDNAWQRVGSPADADSALAVAGINPYTDIRISFSSYGPTADRRLKPNVAACGTVMARGAKGLENAEGTSFAAPMVAGFAACAWQMHPEWTNMEVFRAIEASGHLHPYFDYAHGYGVPQAGYFTGEKKAADTTFALERRQSTIRIIIRERFFTADTLIVKEDGRADTVTVKPSGYGKKNLYYHIRGSDGIIRKYAVIRAERREALWLFLRDLHEGDVLTVHFEGYTESWGF